MELSYCTNVHPAEDLEGIVEQLDRHAGPIRRAAGLDTLGVGLWLTADTAARLASDRSARDLLAAALERNGLRFTTVNAFPYRGFHAPVVKRDVYAPDWTTEERLAYTRDCATVLAEMLPRGGAGSISTLPLGWREPWGDAEDAAAESALASLVDYLGQLEERTGRTVRVGIEPEPGCVLDAVADVVAWLAERPRLLEGGRLGLCLDTCHLAVSFADPAEAVAEASAAGIPIVKVQASVALEVPDPADPAVAVALAPFAEARYLHQVRARPDLADASRRWAADDLDEVLGDTAAWPRDRPWRIHVHIPLHARPADPLRATTEVLEAAVAAVLRSRDGDRAQLDVETYTWSVLPESLQPASLVEGIAAELRWAHEHLAGAIDRVPAGVRS